MLIRSSHYNQASAQGGRQAYITRGAEVARLVLGRWRGQWISPAALMFYMLTFVIL